MTISQVIITYELSFFFFFRNTPSPTECKFNFNSNINIFILIWPKSSLAYVEDWFFYNVYLHRRCTPLEISQHFSFCFIISQDTGMMVKWNTKLICSFSLWYYFRRGHCSLHRKSWLEKDGDAINYHWVLEAIGAGDKSYW